MCVLPPAQLVNEKQRHDGTECWMMVVVVVVVMMMVMVMMMDDDNDDDDADGDDGNGHIYFHRHPNTSLQPLSLHTPPPHLTSARACHKPVVVPSSFAPHAVNPQQPACALLLVAFPHGVLHLAAGKGETAAAVLVVVAPEAAVGRAVRPRVDAGWGGDKV